MKLTEITKMDPLGNPEAGYTWHQYTGTLTYQTDATTLPKLSENIDPNDIKVLIIMKCSNIKTLKELPEIPNGVTSYKVKDCNSLEDLLGSPDMSDESIVVARCNRLRSLKGIPSSAHGVGISQLPALETIDDLPSMMGFLAIDSCYKIDTFSGIQKMVTVLEGFRFDSDHLPKGLLAFLKIEALEKVEVVISGNAEEQKKAKKAMAIINRHIPEGKLLDCQSELLDAELDDYATL